MRFCRPAAVAAAVLFAFPVATPLAAQSLVSWGEAGGWAILVDPTLGNGCLMQAEFQQGEVVRIGFDRMKGNGYLAAFHSGWDDVVEGETYGVSFDLDGEMFEGEAVGIFLGDVPGADIAFDNVDFLAAIAARQTLTLYDDDGAEVMAIDLTGTAEALEAVVACQEEQG